MDFDQFIADKTFDFYGVCNNEFKLDSTVFEAIEDPDDGYRSYMESIEVKDSKGIFFSQPLATVKVEKIDDGSFDGYELVDVSDGHVWLRFGTEDPNDWYPWFVFEYKPKYGEMDANTV